MSSTAPGETGTIVAAYGRHYLIELADGRRITGFPPGKKSDLACGDQVEVEMSSLDQAAIRRHLPRRSLLYRSDAWRQTLSAANVTQLLLVTATTPAFSDELLTRALIAAESQDLKVVIVLNKCDLTEGLAAARAMLAPYSDMGHEVIELSAKQDISTLLPHLTGQTSILVGQSGMGKSTLINTLIPGAAAATREISTALDSGKHTTTHACLYQLDPASRIIDSPGLQEFGLSHLNQGELESGFREFAPYLGHCRFRDCHHKAEPDCAIKNAVAARKISPRRLELFLRIAGQS